MSSAPVPSSPAPGCRLGVLLLLAAAACGGGTAAKSQPERRDGGAAEAAVDAGLHASAAPAEAAADPVPEPEAAPRIERIRVPGDAAATVVRGATSSPPTTVFLPGVCSNVAGYLPGFAEAARRQGGVVGIDGDQPCGDLKDFHTFSWDAGKANARIEAALAAAGLAEIPREGLTLIGYSQGEALAEQLSARWPSRYPRLVLIGAPKDPSAAALGRARAVVTMSCSRDVPAKMQAASARVARAGIPSRYLEMPGCTHGMLADGDRVFGETFAWLRENERPLRGDAVAVRLVGAE
ncbi:MAG: hypothetical protein JWP97_3836 [Labilithrix sp.]|nr:hypothetical protein [Labilithrix sp.]